MAGNGYFSWGSPTGTALWAWDRTQPTTPVVKGYFNNSPTKTGLLPDDLQQAVGIPLQYYSPAGVNPPAVPPQVLLSWIRQAEDWVENETDLLLTPTWVASPPEIQPIAQAVTGAPSASGYGQVQGIDYDLPDAGYDFFFERAQGDGWLCQPLRYRPLRNVTTSAADFTAVKNIAAIYPLLSDFFKVPPTWYVEDQDAGLIRLVPAANVQMLPLFAMQLAFMGFSDTVPGAWHFQYTAGLTPTDYSSRFAFLHRLVLCDAAIRALASIQGTINMGLMRVETLVDGLQTKLQYSEKGPFGSVIEEFRKERDSLLDTAKSKVAGPMFITI